MGMSKLQSLLKKFIDEYVTELADARATKNYKRPFGAIVRQDIASIIRSYVSEKGAQFYVKGSVGAGPWTDVPWIGVFDTRVTKSARKGVYIVYLLNKDKKELYLTLNQGATDASQDDDNDGEPLPFIGVAKSNADKMLDKLHANADSIRKLLNAKPGQLTGKIETGSPAYDAGCIFYIKYSLDSIPEDENLKSDLLGMVDVYEQYVEEVFLKDDVKKRFFDYLGPEDSLRSYVKSYKLVFLKSFFEKRNEQSISHDDMVTLFKSFYMDRIIRGLEADYDADPVISNIDSSSMQQILSVIRNNPYNAISSKGFFSEEGATFKMDDKLWASLTEEDKDSIVNLLNKKLELYYKQYEAKNRSEMQGSEEEVSTKETIETIKRYIASEGFNYDDGLIENFYLSLKAKPFVLLAGTSGTGKTRLVRLFAEAIGAKKKEKDDTEENNSRYLQVAVKPDWSDSTDLFGHVNLKNEFVPGAIIEFIKKAEDDPEKLPYILCLDEMNLARVEYYFSDFLSVMETRDRKGDSITTDRLIPKGCYSGDEEAGKLYADLIIPENLYIVGTVNMDETTFPFSKKVLDRANTIEFSHVDFELPDEFDDKEVAPSMVGNDFLKANYLNLKKDCKDRWESVNTFNDTVSKVNDILKKGDAHFGYRMRDEIIFYMLYNEDMGLLSEKEAFDNQIMQKILPRIQGSSETTANLLKELFTKVCAGPYTSKSGQSDARKMEAYLSDGGIADYPKSAKKICMMLRRYEDDDFTSFWV